jgi:hypothetical protein
MVSTRRFLHKRYDLRFPADSLVPKCCLPLLHRCGADLQGPEDSLLTLLLGERVVSWNVLHRNYSAFCVVSIGGKSGSEASSASRRQTKIFELKPGLNSHAPMTAVAHESIPPLRGRKNPACFLRRGEQMTILTILGHLRSAQIIPLEVSNFSQYI